MILVCAFDLQDKSFIIAKIAFRPSSIITMASALT
jgi:hypothetical protein